MIKIRLWVVKKEVAMKGLTVLLMILGFNILWTNPAFSDEKGNLRYSIMVAKFENRANYSGQFRLGDAFGSVLTDSLQQVGKFIVIGEKDMRVESMVEQDLGASGRMAGGKKTPKIGQMTPAQLLVKGEITHFQSSTTGGGGGFSIKGFKLGGKKDKAEINAVVYIVDSTTGQVVGSKKVVGKASRLGLDVGFSDKDWSADMDGFMKTNVGKAMEKAIDQAVSFLTEQIEDIPWTGSVILVKGDKVYLNRGSREGVQKGQNFIVGQTEELRDPDTGELLDQSMEEVGTIIVETVKEKISIAKTKSGSGKIAKGMTVMNP